MKKILAFAVAAVISTAAFAQQKTLIIDAAHGGTDQGAVAPTGVSEQYITLQIAEVLKEKAIAAGYVVVMTRSTTEAYPTLQERAALRSKYAQNAWFVSIHGNSSQDMAVQGIEVIYDGNSGASNGSKIWAEKLQQELKGLGEAVTKEKKLAVLSDSQIPAIAVEAGYITNMVDLNNLEDVQYKAKLADRILASMK